MTTISKSDLAKELANTTGINQEATKAFLDGFLEQLAQHLRAGYKVQFTGFELFEVHEPDLKPGTPEKIEIPVSKLSQEKV